MAERGDRFLLLFALASAGGVIAYMPLLTLLLPAKVTGLAGGARIEWLAEATLFGAIAASVGNIAWGWASDLTGSRRGWAAVGLCLTIASYGLVDMARTEAEIVGAIVVYQLALNMLLGPLFAWGADVVPDRRKGLLGGFLAAGPPIGALAGVLVTRAWLAEEGAQLALVCAMVAALAAPLLLAPLYAYPDAPAAAPRPPVRRGRDFALMWAARLLVQVAGNLLFGFLLYYFQGLPGAPSAGQVATLYAATLIVAFPVALAAGRLSDRLGPRKPFLIAAAVAIAIGLAVMASQPALGLAIAGYALFSCATSVFLALHAGFSMQLLPSPTRRGRDMGVLNLTNTLPAIVAPLLAMLMVPGRGFGPLLWLLAALVCLGAVCILLVRSDFRAE